VSPRYELEAPEQAHDISADLPDHIGVSLSGGGLEPPSTRWVCFSTWCARDEQASRERSSFALVA
jgi:hypothetical protein